MFKRHYLLTSLCLVLVAAVVLMSYSLFQSRQAPKVYSFTLMTADLRINDIEFAVINSSKSLYISDHVLERIGEDKQISDVVYRIDLNGVMVLSLSQQGNPFTLPDAYNGKINYTTRNLIKKVKVRPDDEVTIQIKYKVNGITTTKEGKVKLKKIEKPFSTTGDLNKNFVRL